MKHLIDILIIEQDPYAEDFWQEETEELIDQNNSCFFQIRKML